MVDKWGGHEQDVTFIAITIDEPYALVTWSIEHIMGDAILMQNGGYWELINIKSSKIKINDFENVDVPLEIAQRLLKIHNQKLKY